MRLDGRNGDRGEAWHAEECRRLSNVLWIDDETAQWCEYDRPIRIVNEELATTVYQARKIVIYQNHFGHGWSLAIVNPVEDADDAGVTDAVSHGTKVNA